jgi:hypothetical protein
MKTLKLVPIGILLLLSVATVSAQTTLPDPHNDGCWSSLAALRACQLQAEQKADDYAQRCSSYPEYQCNNYYQPEQQKTSAKHVSKTVAKTPDNAPATAINTSAASDANTQASNGQ